MENTPIASLASPQEVAEVIGLTVTALANMRMTGTGPKFVRLGPRHIRYRWADVEAWMNENTHQSTDEYTDQPGTFNAKTPA